MDNKIRLDMIPEGVKSIMAALRASGYKSFVVGGAVRDMLLGQVPHDFDVATDARPEQVVAALRAAGIKEAGEVGKSFGVVLARLEDRIVEIASFRGELYGEDAHRPTEVWYCADLEEDLARRDFTINAMAIDAGGNLYDYFGGEADLRARLVRPVGDAHKRYAEDGLRMLRACRFVAQLDFAYTQDGGTLEPFGQAGTPYYLKQNFYFPTERVRGLSLERVRIELDKMLMSKAAGKGIMLLVASGISDESCVSNTNGQLQAVPILPELRHLVGLKQNPCFHCFNTLEHTLTALDRAPRDLTLRWALLLHDVAKGMPGIRQITAAGQPSDHGHEAQSAVMTEAILTRLGYPSRFKKRVVWLVGRHMRFAPLLHTPLSIPGHQADDLRREQKQKERTRRRWLRAEAVSGEFRTSKDLTQAFEQLKEVFLADMGATNAGKNDTLMRRGDALGNEVIALAYQQMPIHTSDLKITGKEILEICGVETDVAEMLHNLLLRVRGGALINENDVLRLAASNRKKRLQDE